MSEISITRFQPALVAREKINSVQAIDTENGLEQAENPLEHKQDQQQSAKHKTQSESESSGGLKKLTDVDKDNEVSAAKNSSTEHAVSRLNEYVQSVKRDIIFDFDPDSGEPSVTVVDRESRKVLRQFDSVEAQELARKLESQEPISLFKAQV
ncbi:MAG: flagellar protein FlaG [Pseudohongiella sp.]|nr:flagellar protein FlaG [Pseudohongiella sp.]